MNMSFIIFIGLMIRSSLHFVAHVAKPAREREAFRFKKAYAPDGSRRQIAFGQAADEICRKRACGNHVYFGPLVLSTVKMVLYDVAGY